MSFKHLLARIGLALLSLWGVTVLTFVLLRVIPGDPALLMAPVGASQADIAAIRVQFGLSGPIWAQYMAWIWGSVRGQFGKSLWLQQDAIGVIIERLPATLELALVALVLAVLGGILLGVLSVLRRRTWFESVTVSVGVLGVSIPNFIWGLLFIVFFGALLRLLPISGRIAPELEAVPATGFLLLDTLLRGDPRAFGSVLSHLILPAWALALPLLAMVFRTIRSDLLTAVREEYVVMEQVKGLGGLRILCWRALKNALIPTATLVGVQFGFLIGGTILIETIFSWPGIGQLTLAAFQYRDFPLIQGIVVIYAVSVILANFLIDLGYTFLNPKVRYA
jgi:peptide/nickel transport system permease protein